MVFQKVSQGADVMPSFEKKKKKSEIRRIKSTTNNSLTCLFQKYIYQTFEKCFHTISKFPCEFRKSFSVQLCLHSENPTPSPQKNIDKAERVKYFFLETGYKGIRTEFGFKSGGLIIFVLYFLL